MTYNETGLHSKADNSTQQQEFEAIVPSRRIRKRWPEEGSFRKELCSSRSRGCNWIDCMARR